MPATQMTARRFHLYDAMTLPQLRQELARMNAAKYCDTVQRAVVVRTIAARQQDTAGAR